MKIDQLVENKLNEKINNAKLVIKVIEVIDDNVTFKLHLHKGISSDKINDVYLVRQDAFQNEYVQYISDTTHPHTQSLDFDYIKWLKKLAIRYTPINHKFKSSHIFLRDCIKDE